MGGWLIRGKIWVFIIQIKLLKCLWNDKWLLLIWGPFQKEESFPFWNLIFHFRDNDVSALCKLDKWWHHEVCSLRSFHYTSIALCIPYCAQFYTWLVRTLENGFFFIAGPRYRSKSSFLWKTSVVTYNFFLLFSVE